MFEKRSTAKIRVLWLLSFLDDFLRFFHKLNSYINVNLICAIRSISKETKRIVTVFLLRFTILGFLLFLLFLLLFSLIVFTRI